MTAPNIECELRAFLTKAHYDDIIARLRREAMFGGEDEQVTYYLSGPNDLRIQRNSNYAKIWMKKGAMHDEAREEIEVRCPRDEFENLEKLFAALGYGIEIKWFRKRIDFKLQDVVISLDDTKGYGYVIEAEKVCFPGEREKALEELRAVLEGFGIRPTPKEEFDEKYAYYKAHWKELTGTS